MLQGVVATSPGLRIAGTSQTVLLRIPVAAEPVIQLYRAHAGRQQSGQHHVPLQNEGFHALPIWQ